MPGHGPGYGLTAEAPGWRLIAGKFTTDGANAPSAYELPGMTIAAPSTGVYTITLTHGIRAGFIAVGISLEDSTGNANDTVRWGDLDAIVTAGTFTIITASSAGTDANLTGPVVHFALLVRDTSLTK